MKRMTYRKYRICTMLHEYIEKYYLIVINFIYVPNSSGGIPARNARGERLLLFLGVIDILQSYRLKKKLEHTWKSMIHDGVSHTCVMCVCTCVHMCVLTYKFLSYNQIFSHNSAFFLFVSTSYRY